MQRPSLFRRVVSLLLAVLVLTASVGLTVQRSTCRLSGQSTVAVSVVGQGDVEGCGGQLVPAKPVIEDNCCDFSSHLHKLSAPAHDALAAKVLVPVAAFTDWRPAAVGLALPVPALAVVAYGPRWLAAGTSPPPLSGRERLTLVCKLVV